MRGMMRARAAGSASTSRASSGRRAPSPASSWNSRAIRRRSDRCADRTRPRLSARSASGRLNTTAFDRNIRQNSDTTRLPLLRPIPSVRCRPPARGALSGTSFVDDDRRFHTWLHPSFGPVPAADVGFHGPKALASLTSGGSGSASVKRMCAVPGHKCRDEAGPCSLPPRPNRSSRASDENRFTEDAGPRRRRHGLRRSADCRTTTGAVGIPPSDTSHRPGSNSNRSRHVRCRSPHENRCPLPGFNLGGDLRPRVRTARFGPVRERCMSRRPCRWSVLRRCVYVAG